MKIINNPSKISELIELSSLLARHIRDWLRLSFVIHRCLLETIKVNFIVLINLILIFFCFAQNDPKNTSFNRYKTLIFTTMQKLCLYTQCSKFDYLFETPRKKKTEVWYFTVQTDQARSIIRLLYGWIESVMNWGYRQFHCMCNSIR